MKKLLLITMLFALISTFAFAAKKSKYITPVPKNGQITIKKSQLSKDATYINYKAGDITVQLIAVIADDNTYRISFTQTDSELIVSTEILKQVAPAFKNWQGPVN